MIDCLVAATWLRRHHARHPCSSARRKYSIRSHTSTKSDRVRSSELWSSSRSLDPPRPPVRAPTCSARESACVWRLFVNRCTNVCHHTQDLSVSLASDGRIEWQHGVPDQRVQHQRRHMYVPAHHDTWRPSSARAHAQGGLLVLPCCCLLAPLSPGSSFFFLSTHNVSLTTAGACMTTRTTGDCCVSRCSDGHLARPERVPSSPI